MQHDKYIREQYHKGKTLRQISVDIRKGEKYVRERAREMDLYEPKGAVATVKKKLQRPPAEYTNVGGYLYLLDKYSPQ